MRHSNGRDTDARPDQVVAPRIVWIASISSRRAAVFSRLRSLPPNTVEDINEPAPPWWLEPEVDVSLALPNSGPESGPKSSAANDEEAEDRLACLIADALNRAKAEARFDDLVVVALPSACLALRHHLSEASRAAIVAEIGVSCDEDVQGLQAILHCNPPGSSGYAGRLGPAAGNA